MSSQWGQPAGADPRIIDAVELVLLKSGVAAEKATAAAQAAAEAAASAALAAAKAIPTEELLAQRAPVTRVIGASGLATGGGDLTANRSVHVEKAAEPDAEALTSDVKAMTPKQTGHALRSHPIAAVSGGTAKTFPQWLEDLLGLLSAQAGGGFSYDTKAQLLANTTAPDGSWAQVLLDGADNGLYQKEAGAWVRKSTATLPALDARTAHITFDDGSSGFPVVFKTPKGVILIGVERDTTLIAKLPIAIGHGPLSLTRDRRGRYTLAAGNPDGSMPIGGALLDPSQVTTEGDPWVLRAKNKRLIARARQDGKTQGSFVTHRNVPYVARDEIPFKWSYRQTTEGVLHEMLDRSGRYRLVTMMPDASILGRWRDERGRRLATTADVAPVPALQARVDRALTPYGLPRDEIYAPWAMRETRQRLRTLLLGGVRQFELGVPGDSWSTFVDYYLAELARFMCLKYGDAGPGYTSFGLNVTNFNGNARPELMTVAKAGAWASEYGTAPTPDHCVISSSTPGDLVAVTYLGTADISSAQLYAIATADGQSQYRWSDDGINWGAWIPVDLTGGGAKIIDLAGIPPSGWKLHVQTVSGGVNLCGLNSKTNNSGVIVHKLGAAGSKTRDWAGATTNWSEADKATYRDFMTALAPHALVVFGGTNSQSAYSADLERTYMQTVIDLNRAALPYADHALITSPENARVNARPMSDYAAVHRELAHVNGIAHLDLQPAFGSDPAQYADGTPRGWLNPSLIHPSTGDAGGSQIIIDRFLRLLGDI